MRTTTGILAAAALLLSACGSASPTGDSSWLQGLRSSPVASQPPRSQPPEAREATLATFDGCSAFLDHVRGEALRTVGPYGVGGGWGAVAELGVAEATAPADGRAAAPAHSTTNIQVAGVDEADIVKTDGRRILAAIGGQLHLFALDGGAATLERSIPLDGWSHELLVAGERAVVISNGGGWAEPMPGPRPLASSLPVPEGVVVTVHDVSTLDEVSRTTFEGSYVSARMVDDIVRIVLRSRADRLAFVTPDGERDADEATRANRELISSSTATDWLPAFETRTGTGTERGPIATCESTYRPEGFSGFGMTTVVTLDPQAPTPGAGAAVLGDASTVYASPDNLYVATSTWPGDIAPAPQEITTDIHRFDISGEATYVASGAVAGSLLNQFSIDEHDGHLRVATTTGGEQTESGVTVLSVATLVPVGRVDGLGVSERIYAVRFMGDVGYVVTFRQVDPLYVLDLSDPNDPRTLGELKIPGYSAYLHPLGDDHLLGVGQDATTEGRTTGTQISLFDVSDPARPERVDTLRFDGAHSDVEHDHRAFLHWAPTDLVVMPLSVFDDTRSFVGAIGIRAEPGTDLGEIGRVSHPDDGHIQRSIVVGDRLFTLSDAGLGWSDLATLDGLGFAPLPTPSRDGTSSSPPVDEVPSRPR